MSEPLQLSRYKLQQFLICQRRFQLRYRQELPWPAPPPAPAHARAAELGGAFHQLAARHFLGLPVEIPAESEELRAWWRVFREQGPDLPAGMRWPEASLTIPVGGHLLTGRFDLVIFDEADERAHIFDWKTERQPRPAAALAQDWQTRLYLALLVRGGQALTHTPAPLPPGRVHLTYWFVNAPHQSITFDYDAGRHEATWNRLTEIVAQIDARLAEDDVWPLTNDWSACAHCAYQVFCGRQAAAGTEGTPFPDEPEATAPPPAALEPDWQ